MKKFNEVLEECEIAKKVDSNWQKIYWWEGEAHAALL
jgi:hypothetical protein